MLIVLCLLCLIITSYVLSNTKRPSVLFLFFIFILMSWENNFYFGLGERERLLGTIRNRTQGRTHLQSALLR